jgi:lipopolysaccharide/colanic/teichoic acid biosynthesis glycosyltransferase
MSKTNVKVPAEYSSYQISHIENKIGYPIGRDDLQREISLTALQQYDPDTTHLVTDKRHGYYLIKRVFDFSIALILLILLSPLLLFISIAIFIYSPGPIFFMQERVGAKRKIQNGQTLWERANFRCYKFRTMKLNADSSIHQAYIKALIENNEAQMQAAQIAATRPRGAISQEQLIAAQKAPTLPRKLVNDDRVIAPGKILRKLSLDELPQLLNVLRGDMSLIGPRPAIPYEVEMYKPWHKLRLQAQPGISGLQQITARSTADFDEQVMWDIAYIKDQSIWLDLKIALKTPLVVISARGAY